MRFSVYQVSRKGGRAKNEDRMGYCYTRSAGLFALADGMGGHPEGEVASQLALQTLSAMFQRDAKPTLQDPLRFLRDAILAAHHQFAALCHRSRAARHAAHHRRGLRAARPGGVLGALRRFALYLLRGDKLVARTRDHSYTELQGALAQSGQPLPPEGQRFNRNVLFTCLGSPGKPVVDTVGPLLLQPGDRVMLCSDGLWGTVSDGVITEQMSQRPISDAVARVGRAGAAQWRRAQRQRHRAGGGVGGRRGPGQHPGSVHALARRGGLSPPPSRPAWPPAMPPKSWTRPRSSARSAKSTRRSAARRTRSPEVN